MDANKASDTQYVPAAEALLVSMATHGFDPAFAVPVDPHGELLGGAHRLACALALGVSDIPVERRAQHVWAPPWGEQWFVSNGMAGEELERVGRDWEALRKPP